MLKKLIFTLSLLTPLLLSAQNQGSNYKITVKLNSLKAPSTAYLVSSYAWTNQRVIDSATVNNGTFVFKGTAPEPKKVHLVINHTGQGFNNLSKTADVKIIYIDKGDFIIKGSDSVKYATITGSKLNTEYSNYHNSISSAFEQAAKDINSKYQRMAADQKDLVSLNNNLVVALRKISLQRDSLKYIYIKQNPDSYFSLEALIELAGKDIDVYNVEPIFKGLSSDLRNSKMGKDYAKLLYDNGPTSLGAMAPGFTQNDVNGKPVSLADFKGQYVLLDFWASWCGPCRQENPNVVAAYNKFKNNNFTVLGISLDNPGKKEAWLEAIKVDGLPWTQVSDLLGWKNAVAALYKINAIPKNFLIDPTGKIIAKNLRGVALEKTLSEILIVNKKN